VVQVWRAKAGQLTEQHVTTPSIAPGSFSYDTSVYVVLNDFGKLGTAYVETDEAQADESAIVSNIIQGQYSSPIRVVAFDTHEGWSRDVTEDIARTILALNRRGIALSGIAREFVERVTGESPTVAV
jgi:hypothetical protein